MEEKPNQRHVLIVYGQVFVDVKTGLPINYSLVPADRLRRDDCQLISEIFSMVAPRELWKWRKPSEIAYVIGLGDFGAAGSMRASKSMRLLNGDERKKSNGQNLVLCPPLRVKTALNEMQRERAELVGFDDFKIGPLGVSIDDLLEAHFDFSAKRVEVCLWLTASQIVKIIGGSLEYGHVHWLRMVSKSMRHRMGNKSKRSNGRDMIMCPPLKKKEENLFIDSIT